MQSSVNGFKERNEVKKNGTNLYVLPDPSMEQINEKLEKITQYLSAELTDKQRIIEEQRKEIERLKAQLDEKDTEMEAQQHQLTQNTQHTEGHRQLINKLLNDIEHFQNDIEWYKRTYERRSIWGVLKEKLTRKK